MSSLINAASSTPPRQPKPHDTIGFIALSSAALFRQAAGRFATGVAVLATRAPNGDPHGLTINSFSSISLHPPIVMVSVAHDCTILHHFECGSFAVNILRENQVDLSVRFAELDEGRFTGIAWQPGVTGSPMIEGVLAVLDCKIIKTLDVGDHRVFFGEVLEILASEGRPLLFFASGYAALE
jgi:flavin reductase (DIM6/NTAB) family NADH-FMN oxidoreductase RutF